MGGMIKHLTIIAALAVTAFPSLAEDIFQRIEREKREFEAGVEREQRQHWREGRAALWLPTEDRKRAEVRSGNFDDEEAFEAYEQDNSPQYEADYRDDLCAGMWIEVSLDNGSRADCISDTHAIEVDFSEKWAEALGQALSYAGSTGLKPGIFLVCRKEVDKCLRHRLRLDEAISAWNLPVKVWGYDG